MVRRISGKLKTNTVSHYKSNNNYITIIWLNNFLLTLHLKIIVRFNHYRLTAEREKIDFHTNVLYSFNDVFTLHEMKQAIKIARDTSPCIDIFHYQLFKHLPDDSILLLLLILNHVWLTQDFPASWKTATAIIIPVPKPDKVVSYSGCYRPIVLTSRLCKTMGRVFNSRLTPWLFTNINL